MATYNGITLTPNTGSGTSQLSVSAAAYTGRENRSATFSASNSSLDIDSNNSIKITQLGHDIFSVNSPTINSDVTSVTVQGQSNLESIRITGGGTLWNYFSTATINGVTVTKSQLTQGYTVPGDPGASAVYNVSFSFVGLPESVNLVTYNGYINNSSSLKVTVKKRGTGTVINDIWFSNGASSSSSTSPIEVGLDADGNYSSGAADPRINTDPSTLSWTIEAD